jgi:competence protein ComEC
MRGRPLAWLCALTALALWVAAQLRPPLPDRRRADPALLAWLEDPAPAVGGRPALRVEGVVESTGPAREGTRLVLRVLRRESSPLGELSPPPSPLLLELFGPEDLHRGDRLSGLARLSLPAPRRNPGGRDLARELAPRGIFARGTLEAEGLDLLSRGPSPWRVLDRLRRRIAARSMAVASTPERGAVLAALAVGDRSGLDAELEEALGATGLVHVLASAGLHLLLCARLGRRLWLEARLRLPLAAPARTHRAAAAFALLVVLAEALLLWPGWPLGRASLGSALALGATLCGRRADAPTTLFLSLAVLGLLDASSLHDLGLGLSVLGLSGMVWLGPRLRALLPVPPPPPGTSARTRPLRAVLEAVLRVFCQSLAATLCTAPLVAGSFHRGAWLAPFANAVGLWPGLLALPLAALAGPLGLLSPALAMPLFFLADALAGLLLSATRLFSQGPPSGLLDLAAGPAAAPSPLWLLPWLLLVVALFALPPRRAAVRLHSRARRLACALALAAMGLLVLVPLFRALAARRETRLLVTFLSVGEGDAALIRFPGGRAALIDAGGDVHGLPAPYGPGHLDPGARDVLPALGELGVSRLDLVVLTHPHPDHAGGIPALLRRVPVGELWTTGEPGQDALGDTVRALARERGVRLRVPRPGDELTFGAARLEVLAPARWSSSRSSNDNSLVVRLVHGETALLFAGDAEALLEAELAQGGRPVSAQVLKAGHHGSRTSTTDAFLRAVDPRWVVFSAGAQNQFGFPHPDVIARVRALGATPLCTARGAIEVEGDGSRLVVRTWDGKAFVDEKGRP